MHKSLSFFLSLFVFVLSLNASEKIIWDTVHYPPSLISEGNYRNQGFSDMSREMFMFNLKKYKHEIESGSIQKAMQDLESNANFCFTGLTKDKQKVKFIEFSKPFIQILPNKLIIRTKDLKRFKSYTGLKNVVNLHRLLQNSGFNFGYVENKSYSKNIDRLLFINHDKKHLLAKELSDSRPNLVKMLSEELFDYTIEYPTIVSYTKDELNIDVEFSHFPIMDSEELVNLYVGCSQNEFGKKVIKEVNKIIEQNKSMFVHFYKTWLDYDSKKNYQEYLTIEK